MNLIIEQQARLLLIESSYVYAKTHLRQVIPQKIMNELQFALQSRCCQKCGEPGEDSKLCNSLNCLCRFVSITLFDILALIITIVWLGMIKDSFIIIIIIFVLCSGWFCLDV